jgi:hypothetical protein
VLELDGGAIRFSSFAPAGQVSRRRGCPRR